VRVVCFSIAAKRRKSSPRHKPWESNHLGSPSSEGATETLSHTAGNLVVHLIFSTKNRQPLITTAIRTYLFAYLGGIIREMQGTALIINGIADHVHMLVRIRPAQALAEIAAVVKTNSSRWVHQKLGKPFAGQTGYSAFSVSESNVPAVSRYIATQEEHHKKRTFQEEHIAFLKKNKISYDERYIWG
jgi:REP element-mobilizing transposase RayT